MVFFFFFFTVQFVLTLRTMHIQILEWAAESRDASNKSGVGGARLHVSEEEQDCEMVMLAKSTY